MCQPPLGCVPEQSRHACPRTDPPFTTTTPAPFHPRPGAALPAPTQASGRQLLLQAARGRRAARPGRRQGRSAPAAPPRPALRRVYIRRRFRPAAVAAPPAPSPGSARPGPVPCGCPPLSASMRRRRPAACPGHGHQRPLHQLQERGREPRAVSRAGAELPAPGRGGEQFPEAPPA